MSQMPGLTLDQITQGQQPPPGQPLTLQQITAGQPTVNPPQPNLSNILNNTPALQPFLQQAQAAQHLANIAELAQPVNEQIQAMLPGANPMTAAPQQQEQLLRQLAGTQNQQVAQGQALTEAQIQAEAQEVAKTAQHPITGRMESGANALGQGLVGAKAAMYGLFNPQYAAQAMQGEAIEQPVNPNLPETPALKVVGGVAPTLAAASIPGAGPTLAAAQMGISGAGQTREEIAAQRMAGAKISPSEELGYTLASGGLNLGAGFGIGQLGKVFTALSPIEQAAFNSGDAGAIQKALSVATQGTKLAGQGAAINTAAQLVQNKIRQGYNPSAAWDEGLGQAGITGAVLGPIMHLAGEAAKGPGPTPEERTANIATMLRRRGMAQLPGGTEGQPIPPKPLTLQNVVEGTTPEEMERGAVQVNPELAKTPVAPMPTETVEAKAARDQALLEQQRAFEQEQNLKTGVALPSLAEQAAKGQQFETKLTAANQAFAEKAGQPLPPKPTGLMADLAKTSAAIKTAGATVGNALSQLFPVEAVRGKELFAGENKPAEKATLALRGGMNRAMNEHQGAMESLKSAEDSFAKLPVELQRDFQGRMYDNMPQATPELRQIADQMYAITEQRRQQIADLGVDAANDWEREHWNMLWKNDPDAAAILRDRIYGSGKLGGKAAGTLKERTPGDFQSKLEAGLVPVEDNPLKQFALTDEAQRRFIGMGRAVRSLADDGTIIRTDKLPVGMVDITGVLPKSFQEMVKGTETQNIIAAPKEVADLIRNVVTPSWFEGGPVRRGIREGLRMINNLLTQIVLGVSGFHLKKVFGLENPVMRVAEGNVPLAEGAEAKTGLPLIGAKIAAAGRAELPLARGKEIQQQMLGMKPVLDPVHAQIIDALQNSMTAKRERWYDNAITTNFKQAWRDRSLWEGFKSITKAPWAANQWWTQDVIFNAVQKAKLSFAFDALQNFIANNPDASTQEIHAQAGKIADHVDNILGLMNRDNLLWNRTARDMASLLMLSVGWNYGTLRSIFGAVNELSQRPLTEEMLRTGGLAEVGQPVREPSLLQQAITNELIRNGFLTELTPEDKGVFAGDRGQFRATKYWLTSLAAAVAYGTIRSYLTTGKAPQSTVDAMFPKTGEKDKQGHDLRENPGFYSNDIYDWATNPSGTFAGKLSPVMHIAGELWMNRDFQGHQIINPQDPLATRAMQLDNYLALQHEVPISIRNAIRQFQEAPDKLTGVFNAIVLGSTMRQAPMRLSESPMEKMLQQIDAGKRPTMSPEDVQHQQQTDDFVNQFKAATQTGQNGRIAWNGSGDQHRIAQDMARNGYTEEQIDNAAGRAIHPGAAEIPYNDSLTPTDLSKLWTAASPDERKEMLPGLQRRISHIRATKIPQVQADAWKALWAQMKSASTQPSGAQ
jgi:hypothetical protein